MRKVIKKEDKEKSERKFKIILGVILASIMLLGPIGYTFFSSDNINSGKDKKINYNGIDFIKTDYGWSFKLEGNEFITTYNPEETSNITVLITKSIAHYSNQPLYFGIESKEDIISDLNYEIVRILQYYVSRNNFACLSENCTEDYAIKSCDNSNILIFSESEEIAVIEDEGCIVINSPFSEKIRVADAFLFKILGVQ